MGTTPDPVAGTNPFADLAKFVLTAAERNMTLAQSWADVLMGTLKEQSEHARTNLAGMTAALEAMDRTLTSQEEANRAMRKSLEAHRQLIDHYLAAQERTARLLRTAVDDLKDAGQSQIDAATALLTPPAGAAPLTQLMQAWTDTVTRFSGGRADHDR
ncbi:hypothetical protein [Mycolicibacterium sp.]|uniref:hypothetical protein n=1 Tax=Mycolicibacterium sp. TaxID=2320850 RepID=UPI0037C78EFA